MTDKSDTEALAEQVAEIIEHHHPSFIDYMPCARDIARRLQPARVTDGWMLVPEKITEQMYASFRYTVGSQQKRWTALIAAAPQPEAAQPAGEGGRCNAPKDGRTCYPECSCESEHLCEYTPEPAPSAPADVEADIQKLESYLDDAGYPKDGDAQLTLESLAARLASAPQPTQRGGEGVEAVKQSLTGGGKNE